MLTYSKVGRLTPGDLFRFIEPHSFYTIKALNAGGSMDIWHGPADWGYGVRQALLYVESRRAYSSKAIWPTERDGIIFMHGGMMVGTYVELSDEIVVLGRVM